MLFIIFLSTLLDDYAFCYQIPHSNRYGGIAIYVKEDGFETAEKEDLQIRKTYKCSKCNFESVFVKLTSSRQTYIVGGVYRHPGGDVSHFSQALEKSLNMLDNEEALIDHFFVKIPTKSPEMPISSGILFNDITDHFPIFLIMRSRNKFVSRQQEFGRLFNDTNIKKLVVLLAPTKWEWEEILNINDVDAQYEGSTTF